MQLKDFVSNTVTQLAEGVQDAINASKGKGYLVNPSVSQKGNTTIVYFDLSVESDKEAGANIKVLNGNLSEKSVNKITFQIAVNFPVSGKLNAPDRPREYPSSNQDQ